MRVLVYNTGVVRNELIYMWKIKLIKNPVKQFYYYFYFIKSETKDSFVSHFDGHFAYLNTLDFYFKFCPCNLERMSLTLCHSLFLLHSQSLLQRL